MGALEVQVGGNHYKHLAIQPAEYAFRNKLGNLEGYVIKYVTRWRDKGGPEDLRKAIHCLELLLEFNGRWPDPGTKEAAWKEERSC